MYFLNCDLFFFIKIFILFIYFFENFFDSSDINLSLLYLFFLKLNSSYNLCLMYLLLVYLFFKISVFYKYIIFLFFFDIFTFNLYYNISSVFTNKFAINSSLTNGLLLIHPLILYIIFTKSININLSNLSNLSNFFNFFFKKN